MGRVNFGLSNVHYCTKSVNAQTGAVTFSTPVAWPGAVSLSLDPEGDTNTFYADNIPYAVFETNNGFSGTLEVADIPDAVATALLGWRTDTDGNLVETTESKLAEFCLLFEVSSNDKAMGYTYYNCILSRPNQSASTSTESSDPDTNTLDIAATPIDNGSGINVVRTRTKFASDSARTTFFTTAPELPTFATAGGSGGSGGSVG